jgi:hypothetical protein
VRNSGIQQIQSLISQNAAALNIQPVAPAPAPAPVAAPENKSAPEYLAYFNNQHGINQSLTKELSELHGLYSKLEEKYTEAKQKKKAKAKAKPKTDVKSKPETENVDEQEFTEEDYKDYIKYMYETQIKPTEVAAVDNYSSRTRRPQRNINIYDF